MFNTILQQFWQKPHLRLHRLYWSDVLFSQHNKVRRKKRIVYLAQWLGWASILTIGHVTAGPCISAGVGFDLSAGWSSCYCNDKDTSEVSYVKRSIKSSLEMQRIKADIDLKETPFHILTNTTTSGSGDPKYKCLWSAGRGYSRPELIYPNAAPNTSKPTISGTAKIGSTLTANATGSDTDTGDTVTLAYQWFRGDASTCTASNTVITSATSDTYTPVSTDIGKKLCVKATPNDGKEDGPAQTSDPTQPVLNYGNITVSIDENVSETGSTTTGTVTVPENLSSALTVNLSSSDTGEATVDSSVTIAAGLKSQTFTVTGVNDDDIDGTQSVTITATATYYTDGTGNVTVIDDDRATVNVTTSNVNITEGGSTSFGVVLSTKPEALVEVDASPLNLLDLLFPKAYALEPLSKATVTITLVASEQLSLDKETLTFTSENWNTPQTVTASTVDNSNVDGNRTGTITISSTSKDDENYNDAVVVIDGSDGNKMTINIADNDVAASESSSGGSAPPQPDFYTLSVAGSQAHIKSSPSGIDCEYGAGSCSKLFDRGQKVTLELVALKTADGFSQDDYNIEWFGDADCADQIVTMHDARSCAVRVYGKQGIDYSASGNTTDNSVNDDTTVTGQLEFLNFSGHGILRGGAEDVILGFILEGQGTADVTLHADIIDAGVIPKFDLNQVLHDETIGYYGKLLDQQQKAESFTFDKTVEAGAYTIQLSSNGVKGRGMAGITLKNNSLNLTNLSVRGHLKEALVLNFIVNGEGSQKASISSTVLQGQPQTQMTLLNLATLEAIAGTLASGTTVEIGTGAYAVILETVQGSGIGMISIDLAQ